MVPAIGLSALFEQLWGCTKCTEYPTTHAFPSMVCVCTFVSFGRIIVITMTAERNGELTYFQYPRDNPLFLPSDATLNVYAYELKNVLWIPFFFALHGETKKAKG